MRSKRSIFSDFIWLYHVGVYWFILAWEALKGLRDFCFKLLHFIFVSFLCLKEGKIKINLQWHQYDAWPLLHWLVVNFLLNLGSLSCFMIQAAQALAVGLLPPSALWRYYRWEAHLSIKKDFQHICCGLITGYIYIYTCYGS